MSAHSRSDSTSSARTSSPRGRESSTTRDRAPEHAAREALVKGAHLAVLSTMALAQPLFDILGRNPEFFAIRGSSSREIVLFALVLAFVPALVLLGVELAVGLISRSLSRALHLVFVGGLTALVVLQALVKASAVSGVAALVIACLLAGLAALAYARVQPVRLFLTVLAPVPLVFLGLFLFNSPVSKLVFVSTPEVKAATVRSSTPVVLIVLDEFSTVSLMDRRQRIDARRYPNFAALARRSTWFRDATTVYWLSEVAVPTVLTGLHPVPGRLPVYSEYPHSIFTLLGGSYRVRGVESLTHICPARLCGSGRANQAVKDTTSSLASDVGIVYLHLLLPEPYVRDVAPIDDSWGNFGQAEDAGEPVRHTAGAAGIPPPGRNFEQLLSLIGPSRKPTLYVLHSLLPHVPYIYLPSGRRYAVDTPVLRGLKGGRWNETWPALLSYQRYLLQARYTDRVLGLVMRKLRAAGLYDRSLIVVTADHGVSFRLGQPRRRPTRANLQDIAFVPLFVKLPRQGRGRVVEGTARTVDVVPTIARVLGVRPPWQLDGQPLVGRTLDRNGRVSVITGRGQSVGAPLPELRARRARALREQIAVFGTGSPNRVYRIGPNRALLGRTVAGLRVQPSQARVDLDGRALLDAVDPSSGLLPSYLEGQLRGLRPGAPLAIAVNGRIAAVTRAFDYYGQTRLAAFVPENALRPGRNTVAVYTVRRSGNRSVLGELKGSDTRISLREAGGGEVIAFPDGKRIPVRAGSLRGSVGVSTTSSGYSFEGRASRGAKPSNSVVVFVDGQAVYSARTILVRPKHVLGQRAAKDGFEFELPRALLPAPAPGRRVRVFAILGGSASELRYTAGYPWP